MWTTKYILSQICVIVALILYGLTYLVRTKKQVLIINAVSTVFTVGSFILLGAYSGAVINLLAIARSIWFFCDETAGKQSWFSLIFMTILFIGAATLTYESIIDLLPLAGGLIYTVASWQKNIRLYRWLGALVSVAYLPYHILLNSIFGIISESIALLCAIVGIILGYIKIKKVA